MSLLGDILNIGPFPIGGGSHSINPSIYRLGGSWRAVAGASQRHIFDLGNMENSLRIIPTGVSGNFMSPHYDDQTEQWLKVGYRPFQLEKSAIENDAAYTLRLTPQAASRNP
jgi:penicillin amidase